MYHTHQLIPVLHDDTVLWRYTNLEKFLAMLSTASLYFCRADKFKDRWEASWPTATLESIKTNWKQEGVDYFLGVSRTLRTTFFANCWHRANYESAAFWDQYQHTSAVAITSSIERIKQSVRGDLNYFLGAVDYVDFSAEHARELNAVTLPFRKRKSFEHEREVRLVVSPFGESAGAVSYTSPPEEVILPVNLATLITDVRLAPGTAPWLKDAVIDLLAKYQLAQTPVVQSNLYDDLVY